MIPATVLVVFLSLAATGMKAQTLRATDFAGEFTLPFTVQWGGLTLPAGDYNLYYGTWSQAGIRVVEVAHENLGVVHGLVLARGRDDAKGKGSFLKCVFEGDRAYVRSLKIAEINESIEFARPHGVSVAAWIVADKESRNTNARFAETRIPILPAK